jgi:hypothetical protein
MILIVLDTISSEILKENNEVKYFANTISAEARSQVSMAIIGKASNNQKSICLVISLFVRLFLISTKSLIHVQKA